VSDTQARLDAIRATLHPRDVHHDRCATRHGRPKGPCDCHASRDLGAHEALDALAAELERVTAALRQARPFVASRSYWDDNHMKILADIDAALAGGARAAQEDANG
jgi:hypothetical protein